VSFACGSFLTTAALSCASFASARPLEHAFSSGDVNRPIPDLGTVEVPIRVSGSLPLAKLRVSVRISHSRDSDLVLHLLDPRGRQYLLAARVGGRGHDFGAGGRSCRGQVTTFEDDVEFSPGIAQGTAPFVGSFGTWVEGTDRGGDLGAGWHRKQAAGLWRLRIRDVRRGNVGTLHCWRIETTVAEPDVSAGKRRAVRAALTWTAIDGVVSRVRLRIWRVGRLVRDGPIPTPPFVDKNRPPSRRAVRVVNLDGDREPEVLVQLWTGGAHCCAASEIYDFAPGRGYRETTRVWPDQTSVQIRDVDRDGVVEFVSADGRFCYSCSYPLLAFPVQVLHFGRRFRDVTRAFPEVLREQATRLRFGLRDCFRREPRRFCTPALEAWVADEARRGRPAAAFAFVDKLHLRRGYAIGLRRYLRRLGYLR
jgi:subtilisin-like proprotein convertase family protein